MLGENLDYPQYLWTDLEKVLLLLASTVPVCRTQAGSDP
jgi:hypothetical protein